MTFVPPFPTNEDFNSAGGRLVDVNGRALPLIGAALSSDARGGVARVKLQQTFRNPHDEPLRVTYSLPLPADAAVSGFSFRLGDERVVGRVELKAKAREIFEDALLHGRTAALLDQERSSLFTQEVGNVPPRTEVVCEVELDQKLTWLPDGAWEWRFPTVVAPRYLGAPGRVADASKVTVEIAEGALPLKLSLALTVRDQLAQGDRPFSPSHALHSEALLERTQVSFGDERGVQLDRDVVVRWKVAGLAVGTSLDVARPADGITSQHAYGLLTLVPPSQEVNLTPVPRDLIVLLDTSGSMSGSPLDQARRVTSALVDSLRDEDQLELIEFSNTARRWKRGSVAATANNRRDAQAWLARLSASGGTEMRTGILEALAPLRAESQRQVVLITDGQIGFEHEILGTIHERLPAGCRVHTVGVGSGVNRSLTKPAAQAGRGVELVIGIGEDVEPLVGRLLKRTHAPLLTDVEVSGSAVLESAPARITDVYAGAPALVSLKLKAEGGEVVLRGRSAEGDVVHRLTVKPVERGEGSTSVTALFGRERAEDLELARACGTRRDDAELERIGVEFQISTRLTSWVAVSSRQTVDPRAPKRSETMPHELAYGLSAEGVGLRRSAGVGGQVRSMGRLMPAAAAAPSRARREMAAAPPPAMASMDSLHDDEGAAPAEESASAGSGYSPEPMPELKESSKKKRDLLGGIGARVRGVFAKAESQAPLRFNAQARRVGDKLVLTFFTGAPMQWLTPTTVTVRFRDGSTAIAQVDSSLSTGPASLNAGVMVTLVLELSDTRDVGTVEFNHGNETVVLTVS